LAVQADFFLSPKAKGKNIRELKKQKGLSQSRLSKLADISYNTVIKMESGGITNPSSGTFQKLARALNVSVDELIKIARK